MNFTPFPILYSERLSLRQLDASDSEMVLYLRSDKTINQFIDRPIERQTKNLSDAKNHIKKLTRLINNNSSISWGITLLDNRKLIGTICLWNFSKDLKTAEVGYDLSLESHNKGFMTEALNAVINYGFNQLNLQNIEAYTHYQNESSIALLLKNGFHLLDDKKDSENKNNSIYNIQKTQE